MKILHVCSAFFVTVLLSAGNLFAQADFGDLPDPAYQTKLASNGARHLLSPNLFIGVMPDAEADGFATGNAQGDDASSVDDEDGIDPTLLHPHSGFPFTFPVKVTNNTPTPATLYGYVDWNQDGDFIDVGEFASVTVPGGTINGTANLVCNVPFNAVVTSMTPVRLRFTSNQTPPGVIGQMPDGEVEDFFVAVTQLFDFGDLPDAMVGTAPGTLGTGAPPDYQTMKSDGGPFHAMRQDLNFFNDSGSADAHIDAEPDGQPSPNAQGDDLNGDDDERVLTHTVTGSTVLGFGSAAKVQVNLSTSLGIQNTTGVSAKVIGFIDANGDGDFNDAGESSAIIVPGNGSVTTANLPFTFTFAPPYPIASFTKIFALRYRISTDMVLPPNGGASDGEVHDELISAQFDINYPLPPDFGDLPAPYATLMADNGARHTPTPALFMGTNATDAEVEGLPHATANGDDADATDDEDGFIPASVTLYKGAAFSLPVKASNTTGADAYIRAFADWNQDGDFADANEIATKTVPAGTVATVLTLPWSVPFHVNAALPVALRLRLSPNPALPHDGSAVSGEVEDYLVQVQTRLDFGDLPAPYATLIADGGASHVIRDGLSFENDTGSPDADVDAESDGQPSANASADNTNGDDDELGLIMNVTRQTVSGFGASTTVEVDLMSSLAVENTTGVKANAVFFIDANSDGDFTDAGESVSTTVAGDGTVHAVAQTHTFSFTAPYPTTSFSKTFAMRFRLSTDTTVPPVGPASDGEVHDQFVTHSFNVTYTEWDFGDLPSPYQTRMSFLGASHTLSPDLFLGNVMPDPDMDGSPSAFAQGDDTSGTDDEDGFIHSSVVIAKGQHVSFPFKATNTTGGPAFIRVFADWNQDGDFTDPEERRTQLVPNGTVGSIVLVEWNVPFTTNVAAPVAMRVRLSTSSGTPEEAPGGIGEVEDYMIQVVELLDFGDLQDSLAGLQSRVITNGSTTSIGDFQTRLADDGARHVMRQDLGIILESATIVTDDETDGHPGPDASGDDLDGTADDEESAYYIVRRQIASFPNYPARPAQLHLDFEILASLALRNETGGDAYLTAFIDGNGDGDFADAGETQVNIVPHSTTWIISEFTALPYSITVVEPITSGALKIPVRFRLSTQAGLGASGLAADGEVEDYVVNFSWATGNYWDPNTPSISTHHFDIGLPSILKGDDILRAKPIRPGSRRWHIGPIQHSGDDITLSPSQLQSLGTGRHWLSHTVAYADGTLGGYLSQVQITDLPGYRSSLQGQGLTGENAAPDADPDGDGHANFLEHALGSHPNLSGDRPPLITAPESPAPGSKLILTYLRRTGGSSSGANYNTGEISYCPQGSTTLNTWDTPMEVPVAPPSGLPTPPPGYEWGTARLSAPMSSGTAGFIRLSITPPAP